MKRKAMAKLVSTLSTSDIEKLLFVLEVELRERNLESALETVPEEFGTYMSTFDFERLEPVSESIQ